MNLVKTIFERAENKDKPAYIYQGNEVSYQEFFDETARLANGWEGLGVQAGDRIIICLPDSPMVSMLFCSAISQGIIPVIINPNLGLESIQHIVTDSQAKTFVTLASNPHIKEVGTHVLIDDLYGPTPEGDICRLSRLRTEDRGFQWTMLGTEQAAFWQYTSGTTGLPKAVQHSTQTMLLNFERYCQNTLNVDHNAVFFSAAKMFFGYGAGASIFFPLLANATAIVEPAMPVSDLLAMQIITRFKPTHFFAAAPVYAALLKHVARLDHDTFAKITYVSAGSNLPAVIYNQWLESFGKPILDGIGATEVGHIFLANSPSRHGADITGFPVQGYEYRLVDDDGCEDADKGRLLVKTNHVNLGYWNNPEATRNKFCDGWYDTGDLFTRDGDAYTYRGRADDLFKSNGIWVEPLALESSLLKQFSEILECALVPKQDNTSLTYPHLYVVAKESACETSLLKTMQAKLFEIFEKHSAPQKISFLQTLPRNDNGKVSRQQLIKA